VSDARERWAPDLVDRNFTVTRPDVLRVAELKCVASWAGFLYLAVVIDASSSRRMGDGNSPAGGGSCRRWRWPPRNVLGRASSITLIVHGTQYTSIAFGRRCQEHLRIDRERPVIGSRVGRLRLHARFRTLGGRFSCNALGNPVVCYVR
jgi:hypothetical protein